MAVISIPDNIGLVLIILGVVLLCFSIPKTEYAGSLRNVGALLLIVGAIVFVLLAIL